MKQTILQDFEIILPPHRISQAQANAWIARCHSEAARLSRTESTSDDDLDRIEKLFRRYSVKESLIAQRRFECSDMLNDSFDTNRIYRLEANRVQGAGIQERAQFFSEKATEVFRRFYEGAVRPPQHLIHVTCTGYVSPSAPQTLVAEKQWSTPTAITHAYHMGCYAALPAVRMADAFVRSSSNDDPVDIVHTEICGLHMNPLAHTPEQIVVQGLFADGYIKYSARSEGHGLRVISSRELVVHGSQGDMSWIPSSWGMQMTLSREVPDKIRAELRNFLIQMSKDANVELESLLKNAVFAVHPGGPKIVDAVQAELELREDQVASSKKILLKHGNMSSATLPHIWTEILATQPKQGTHVVSFAFGPGLTIFGSIFEVV